MLTQVSGSSSIPITPLLSVGLVTDVHHGVQTFGDRDYAGALLRMRSALGGFAAMGIELVINLGDVIESNSDLVKTIALCTAVRKICATFPGEIRHVVGNHDVEMLSKDTFLAHLGCPTKSYYSFDAGRVHCIILDANYNEDGTDFSRNNISWENSWVNDAQLRWLAADLAAAGPRPSMVFCHQCLDDVTTSTGALDPYVVRNAALVRQILHTGNVRAVFQGHYHNGRRRVIDGISYIALPAVSVAHNVDECASVATLYADGSLRVDGLA